jgi:hypothetical protein
MVPICVLQYEVKKKPSSGMLCRVALLINVFEGMDHLHHQGDKNQQACSVLWLTANILSSPILVTLIMGAMCSSEMLVLTRITQCKIPKNSILHSHHHCENLISYELKEIVAFVHSVVKSAEMDAHFQLKTD